MTTKIQSKYIYAFISEDIAIDNDLTGIDDKPVYTITYEKIIVVVSDCSIKKIRGQRKNIAAHHKVLLYLMNKTTPLPVVFGIISNTTKDIKDFISKNKKQLLSSLKNLHGKAEMTLKVSYAVPNIFEYFIEKYPDLRKMRDVFFKSRKNVSANDKIELGKLFNKLLIQERDMHANTVEKNMAKHCDDIKFLTCRDERLVLNIVCLIEKNREKEFEDAIYQVANKFDDNFQFDYNGPFIPHNFTELNIDI